MSLFKLEHHKDYSLAIWRLEESSAELSSSLASIIGESIDCPYPNEKRQQEFYACRLAATALGINIKEISKHSQGWPILNSEQGYLSFSHSAQFAAVLYSPHIENIGVDIEAISARFLAVAPRYLSQLEWESLQAQFSNKQDLMAVLCLYWSAKEALYKAVHSQGIDFQTSFEMETVSTLSSEGSLSARFGASAYRLYYRFEENHCYCCCLPE